MTFGSAREMARESGVPEWVIRRMIKDEECPGFYSGVKFLIYREEFMKMIEAKCQRPALKTDSKSGGCMG